MATPEPNMNDPEFQLYLEYKRRQKRNQILIAAAVGIPLLLSIAFLVPGLVAKIKGTPAAAEASKKKGKTVKSVALDRDRSHGGGGGFKEGRNNMLPGQEVLEISETGPDDDTVLEIGEKVEERIRNNELAAAARKAEAEAIPENPVEVTAIPPGKESAPRMVAISFPANLHQTRALEIDHLLHSYSEAATVEARSQYVLDPERVRPLMAEYYARPGTRFERIGALIDRQFYLVQGKNEFAIQTHREAGSGSPQQFIALRRQEKGYAIDWESLVGYSQKPWDVIQIEKSTEPIQLRCFLVPNSYYNFEFSDPELWQCYQIADPTDSFHFYGFVNRDSKLDKKLRQAIGRRVGSNGATVPIPAVVEISYNASTKSRRCVRITKFVQETWLVVDGGNMEEADPSVETPGLQ